MEPAPVLRLDLDDPTPAYRQIADGLRVLLVDGGLRPGERLPPVRRLAIDLGVHHNTVAEAYRELAAEGWLTLVRGRGAEVRERRLPADGEEAARRFDRGLAALVAQARAGGASGVRLARELIAAAARLERPEEGR